MNVAQAVMDVLARDGVSHMFGVPGGGTSLDLIKAAGERNIRFVLTRTETGAAFMAATMADLSGSPGVAFATQGPGTASAVNGVAQAWLDKSPMVLFTDGWSAAKARYDSHQRYDQRALLAGIVKGHSRLDGERPATDFRNLLGIAMTSPQGPIYVELTAETASAQVDDADASTHGKGNTSSSDEPIDTARALLSAAKRPVIIAGLEARDADVVRALVPLAETLGCPVLTTYKAKGVMPSSHDLYTGLFTGGALEAPCVSRADLIVFVGFDPVELIGKPWQYNSKVLDLGPVSYESHYVTPDTAYRGDLSAGLSALAATAAPSAWTRAEIARLKADMAERLAAYGNTRDGLSPVDVVKTVQDIARSFNARATIDAGAHMFSAMQYWDAEAPNEILISNGLSTMGYALPAAIASALCDPNRPTVAFTGDGGLLMCAGELATAANVGANIVVVVFNDSGLSLIELKQRARQLPQGNLRWDRIDFARIAEGAGVKGYRATTLDELRAAAEEALRLKGPCLIDVTVDPSGYDQQSVALRG